VDVSGGELPSAEAARFDNLQEAGAAGVVTVTSPVNLRPWRADEYLPDGPAPGVAAFLQRPRAWSRRLEASRALKEGLAGS
jgi:hypothetical protein